MSKHSDETPTQIDLEDAPFLQPVTRKPRTADTRIPRSASSHLTRPLGAKTASAAPTEDTTPAVPQVLAVPVIPEMPAVPVEPVDPVLRAARRTPAETAQAHRVCTPLGMREQLTFYPEPVAGVVAAPKQAWRKGFVFGKDKGGDEFSQLYWFDEATRSTTLLSDGKRSQNGGTVLNADGSLMAWASTARNGTDRDIWVRDTRSGQSRAVLTEGGSWSASDFSPDGTRLLVSRYVSANESYPGELELASGKLAMFPVDGGKAALGQFRYAPDGKGVFYISDEDIAGKPQQFRTLRWHGPGMGAPKLVSAHIPWDVDEVRIAGDGRGVTLSARSRLEQRFREAAHAEAIGEDWLRAITSRVRLSVGVNLVSTRLQLAELEAETGRAAEDITAARRAGCVIKLLAIAEKVERGEADGGAGVNVRVHPAMVPRSHPLASVREAYNAVFVEATAAGELMFYGKGAGGDPTASAVMGDIVAVARHRVSGGRGPGESAYAQLPVHDIGKASTRYHISLAVADRPGVLAQVASVFAAHGVSIQAVRQQVVGGDGEEHAAQAYLIVVTHTAPDAALTATVEALSDLDTVTDVVSVMRVEGS